jgi:hypothetical protein
MYTTKVRHRAKCRGGRQCRLSLSGTHPILQSDPIKGDTTWHLMRARNVLIPSVPVRSRPENIAVQSVLLWKRLQTLIASVGMRVAKGKSNNPGRLTSGPMLADPRATLLPPSFSLLHDFDYLLRADGDDHVAVNNPNLAAS